MIGICEVSRTKKAPAQYGRGFRNELSLVADSPIMAATINAIAIAIIVIVVIAVVAVDTRSKEDTASTVVVPVTVIMPVMHRMADMHEIGRASCRERVL